jgi:hypothetical protein
MAKTRVYRKDTGEIVHVPEHFMDHPVLSKPFRKTPKQRARDEAQQTSTPRTGEAANPKSTNTDGSAKAGDDDKKE